MNLQEPTALLSSHQDLRLVGVNDASSLQARWEARRVREGGRRDRSGEGHGGQGQPERQNLKQGHHRQLRAALSSALNPVCSPCSHAPVGPTHRHSTFLLMVHQRPPPLFFILFMLKSCCCICDLPLKFLLH